MFVQLKIRHVINCWWENSN